MNTKNRAKKRENRINQPITKVSGTYGVVLEDHTYISLYISAPMPGFLHMLVPVRRSRTLVAKLQ